MEWRAEGGGVVEWWSDGVLVAGVQFFLVSG